MKIAVGNHYAPVPMKSKDISILDITNAVQQHIHYPYKTKNGTARIPVLVIFAIYQLLVENIKRYQGTSLAPLGKHTASDLRSKTLGDIEVLDEQGNCVEAIEVKHLIPISTAILHRANMKILSRTVQRYYIFTTSEPNCDDYEQVMSLITTIRNQTGCQIVVNGVVSTLKYYLRLVNEPTAFIERYSDCLKAEYERGSGIKKEHLTTWLQICQQLF